MYMHGADRYEYADDGNLGNWFTTFRDKIAKPVGRVVAAYYTGGASEIAFKAHEAEEARKKQAKAIKEQEAQLAAMGNAYPPAAYPMQGSAIGTTAYQTAQPSGFPQAIPSTSLMYGQPQQYPGQPQTWGVSQEKLPSWALPVGAAVGGVALLALLTRR